MFDLRNIPSLPPAPPVQAIGELNGSPAAIVKMAAKGTQGPGHRLPHLEAIQRSFGRHNVGDIQAHVGTRAQKAAHSMGARAYAYGSHVAFSRAPDLFDAAHEAAHVVRQRLGDAPSRGIGRQGDSHEQLADKVAARVASGRSAEALLEHGIRRSPPMAAAQPAVQRLILRLGDREQGGFLDDEEQWVKADHGAEQTYSLPDKWGNMGEYSHNPYKRWQAKKHGNSEVGPRKSYLPQGRNDMVLWKLGLTEDLRIIAHGARSSDRIAGYTPAKFVRLLVNLGLTGWQKGDIYLHACLPAQPRRDGGTVLEDIYHELRRYQCTNEVWGLRGAAIGGGVYETPLATYDAQHEWHEAEADVDSKRAASNRANWLSGSYRQRKLNSAEARLREKQRAMETVEQQYGPKSLRTWIRASDLVKQRQQPKMNGFHLRWLFKNRHAVMQ